MAYIYVLHFDTKLAHAQHYIGCTEKLEKRLTAHANGAGSRLTRELHTQGITWRLGSLLTTSHRNMRIHERKLKDQAHANRYCGVCSATPMRWPGCQQYPIEAIPFPTDSVSLRRTMPFNTARTIRLSNETDSAATMDKIKYLMKLDKDALGFIPAGGEQGLKTLVAKGKIAIAQVNNELIGYAAYTLNYAQNTLTIHQCCVQDDARMIGIGKELVLKIHEHWPYADIVAKVRTDLAANHFWQAIGFQLFDSKPHETSGKLIHHYRLKTKE